MKTLIRGKRHQKHRGLLANPIWKRFGDTSRRKTRRRALVFERASGMRRNSLPITLILADRGEQGRREFVIDGTPSSWGAGLIKTGHYPSWSIHRGLSRAE
jgi:hypothetical protein